MSYLEDIAEECTKVRAHLSACMEQGSGINVIFFIRNNCDEAEKNQIHGRVELFKRWLEEERPAGISANVVNRYVAPEEILACKSVEQLSGPVEALLQVFGLKVSEDWQ